MYCSGLPNHTYASVKHANNMNRTWECSNNVLPLQDGELQAGNWTEETSKLKIVVFWLICWHWAWCQHWLQSKHGRTRSILAYCMYHIYANMIRNLKIHIDKSMGSAINLWCQWLWCLWLMVSMSVEFLLITCIAVCELVKSMQRDKK